MYYWYNTPVIEGGVIMLDFSGLVLNNRDPIYVQIASALRRKYWAGHVSNGDRPALAKGIAPHAGHQPIQLKKLQADEGRRAMLLPRKHGEH